MALDKLEALYRGRVGRFSQELVAIRKKINTVSNGRIITALLTVGAIYCATKYSGIFYIAAAVLVAVFVALVIRHNQLFRAREHTQNLVKINTWEAEALRGDFSNFATGIEFLDPHHPYALDLDIFGEGSVYQCLNRANTRDARRALAERLTSPTIPASCIPHQQEAVRELAPKIDFRQHLQAAGLEIGEQAHDREELIAWLALRPFLFGKRIFKLLLLTLPPLTLLALAGTLVFAALKPVVFGCLLAQWSILGFHAKQIRVFHEFISRKKIILEKYSTLLSYLPSEHFETQVLSDLSSRAQEADQKIKALSSLVSALNARLNAFATLVLNSLLLYDMQCVYRLERWKQENADNLLSWLDVIRQTEVLSSLGTFAFNHPGFTFPAVGSNLVLNANALGHPLIDAGENVLNDVLIGVNGRIFIVTGANMAGKSTFLRAVGVNLVLAMSGSVVNARKMEFPIVGVRSGMRTTDSLKDHQSYFYAELNRLKSIVDELRAGTPLVLLLDEILKGTNSTDKQAGSVALVQQLLHFPCLAFLATHDLALGKLADEFPQQVCNYRFEAIIEGDKLSFDYRLKEGLAQQMNATFLMKKMGIIPDGGN
jgi:hypothetical protein